jgi:hypothetical protein
VRRHPVSFGALRYGTRERDHLAGEKETLTKHLAATEANAAQKIQGLETSCSLVLEEKLRAAAD